MNEPHDPNRTVEDASVLADSLDAGLVIDYSATKGAINAFTKALAQNLISQGIRVNAVAPGPVWTPLNAADEGMKPEKVAEFGKQTPLERPAQPEEIAPVYVFLASDADFRFLTAAVISPLGGQTTAAGKPASREASGAGSRARLPCWH